MRAESIIAYCVCFGWIQIDAGISTSEEIRRILGEDALLNRYMVESTLRILFSNHVFTAEMFVFDIDKCQVAFRNELLPLSYAPIRNVLISQDFFIINRGEYKTVFMVHPDFENILSQFCKKSANAMTLNQLKLRLEANAVAGAKAEAFVLEYEKRRIHNPILQKSIKLISEIDVRAGYDIVSFESDASISYDRFVEVKAVSSDMSFFWSRNELGIAKLQGEKYFLYLVDLSKIGDKEYNPVIISNPVATIMESQEWFVEPETYHIRKI